MIMIKIPNCICNWLGSTIQCQLSSSKLATLPQIAPCVDGCDGDDDDDNNCNGDNDDNSCDCYDDRDNEVVEGC